MNHLLTSEFSSGCESGWTVYLQQSSDISNFDPTPPKSSEDEEEDLSMVSDASSGPPHFCEEDEYDNNHNIVHAKSAVKNAGKREKITKEYRRRKVQEQLCLLDDTASSPLFNFSSNNLALGNSQEPVESILDFSQGYSSTHSQRKSVFKEHFSLFQPSVSGTQLQQNQWFEKN